MKSNLALVAGGMFATMLLLTACGPKYPNCDTDENCKEKGEYCVDKLCRQCATTEHCKAKGECAFCGANFTCQKPAGNLGDCCSTDLDCRAGKCFKLAGALSGTCAQCGGDSDCGPNMKCVQGGCVPNCTCKGDSECGAGQKCDGCSCITATCSLDSIYFDFDEFTIRADARDILNRDYDCVKKKGGSVVVEGNCDERGSDEYNLALGTRRADMGKKFLINLGLAKKSVSTTSFGEEKPVCSDHSEDCWWKNRRDDLRFK